MLFRKLSLFIFLTGTFFLHAVEDDIGITESLRPVAVLTTEEIMQLTAEKRNNKHRNDFFSPDTNEISDNQDPLITHKIKEDLSQIFSDPTEFAFSFTKKRRCKEKATIVLNPNFTAIAYPEGFLRPDPSGSVGPEQYIAFCIERIRSFDKKNGQADGVLDTTPELFFASVLPTDWVINFPQIAFDNNSKRWFLAATNENNTAPNQIVLAVSNGPVITKRTKWSFYAFPEVPLVYRQSPSLGISANAIYISAVQFVFNPTNFLSEGFVINKKKLLAKNLTVTHFNNLLQNLISGAGPLNPSAVTQFGNHDEVGYFIGADKVNRANLLSIRVINNPGTNPTLSPNIISVPVSPVVTALAVPQKGSNIFLNPRNLVVTASHKRDGFIYYVQTTRLNSSGIANTLNTANRDGIRWYKINVKDINNVVLADEGTLFGNEPDFNSARYYWIPSIMTNEDNTMVVGANTAGRNYYANASFAYRYVDDAPGTLRGPILFTDSSTPYGFTFWGGYNNLSIDPNQKDIWGIQQFSAPQTPNNAPSNWGLQVCRILTGCKRKGH